jgi:hypothetical protein
MALPDYETTAFGGVKAPKRAKQLLLQDLKKGAKSPQEMGLSASQKEQMADTIKLEQQQQARAAAEDLKQSGLAGGGFTGYKAEQARQGQKQAAEGAGAATAGAERVSLQLAQQRQDKTRNRLEAQQERARQNAQFWSQQGINLAAGIIGLTEPLKGFTP